MKKIILLLVALFIISSLSGCYNSYDLKVVKSTPRSYGSDFWKERSVKYLGNQKIPGIKELKVNHEYLAVIELDYTIDEEAFKKSMPKDAVVSGLLIKEDNLWGTEIFSDDPEAVKKFLGLNSDSEPF